jgi:hypothetical protein
VLLAIVGLVLVVGGSDHPAAYAAGCRIYVAAGDHYPAGHELNDDSKRFPERLVADHIQSPGWCLFNIAKNETSSSSYITGGQRSQAWNYRPDFVTVMLGEENPTIVNLVTSCFDKIKDHDFTGGNACAATILANGTLWSNLKSNYITILSDYRLMMSGRPHLVVGVLGYPNPYPKELDATAAIPQLCVPLIDTAPTCTARWAQLPPALVTIDQVFLKLNATIKEAMAPFVAGPNGYRFVYVDTYTKMRDHCMKMEVSFKTTVVHPPPVGTHQHDSPVAINVGCSEPWYVAGSDGTAIPNYLDPPIAGVLTNKSQTTKGMGVHPNEEGHQCIADLIWEADTVHPGTTPLKWLLGYGEVANSDICQ